MSSSLHLVFLSSQTETLKTELLHFEQYHKSDMGFGAAMHVSAGMFVTCSQSKTVQVDATVYTITCLSLILKI